MRRTRGAFFFSFPPVRMPDLRVRKLIIFQSLFQISIVMGIFAGMEKHQCLCLSVQSENLVIGEFQGGSERSAGEKRYTALHCTALHCTALHCTALHCTALHCTALHCTRAALHCTALHCTTLHCTALHCTALHCTRAAHCTAHERRPPVRHGQEPPLATASHSRGMAVH
jgi:hypothetical protein